MYGPQYWYWERHSIPPQFRQYVCRCPEFKYDFDQKRYQSLSPCKNCGGLQRHMIKKCVDCDKFFLKDFHVPSFDVLHPKCWNCIDKDAPLCESTPKGLRDYYTQLGVVPPQMMKIVEVPDDFSFDDFKL